MCEFYDIIVAACTNTILSQFRKNKRVLKIGENKINFENILII